MGCSLLLGEVTPILESKSYQDGLRALEDRLPDLAIGRLQTALNKSSEGDPGIPTGEIRLAEAQVRSGKLQEALDLLENHQNREDAVLWKGYALLGLGLLRESEETFALLASSKSSKIKDQSNMARARILASLRDDRELSILFSALGDSSDPFTIAESQLLHATVLLDKSLLDDCEQLLTTVSPQTSGQKNFLIFLKGHLALLQKDYPKAEGMLKPLTEANRNLSPELFQTAALSYSQALHLSTKNGAAIEFLLDFITKNPESPYLQTCFNSITNWSRGDEVLKEIVLKKLEGWSTPTSPQSDGAISYSMVYPIPNRQPLLDYSLYYRATLLAEKNDQTSVAEAKFLLSRLRIEVPESSLVSLSLLETSQLHLAGQNRGAALSSLQALEQISGSPALRAQAAEVSARIQFDNSDFAEASDSFKRMRSYLLGKDRGQGTFNTGVSLLLAGGEEGFTELTEQIDSEELLIALELERALLSASDRQPSAKESLGDFLQDHGEHSRAPEARLALAEIALFTVPQDISLASAMLDNVQFSALPEPLALRYLLSVLKLADLTGSEDHWKIAIDVSNGFLSKWPGSELKPAIRFKLAEAYYRNNDFSRSQLLFQQVANDESAKTYQEVALFFAARAAIKVTTPEARAEAIALFEGVLALNGTLAGDARIKLAQTHLDSGDYDQALKMLDPLLNKDPSETQSLDALLLKAEALRAKGSQDSDEEALAIYSAALDRQDLPYAKSNHIHYLKGLALESLGKPAQALDTLYQVVNRENLPDGAPVTEWSFYYDCGSKAITLLLEKEDPVAAYALARKISRSGGPKSDDFAARAEDIQLRHMIMEE